MVLRSESSKCTPKLPSAPKKTKRIAPRLDKTMENAQSLNNMKDSLTKITTILQNIDSKLSTIVHSFK